MIGPETSGAGPRAPRTSEEAHPSVATARAIVCRSCQHAITTPEARISRAGSHVHTRINPGGWVHELGCFREAPGCVLEPEAATLDATWFPGYAWRIALCGECHQHLGWRYEGDGVFWGLILDKLAG